VLKLKILAFFLIISAVAVVRAQVASANDGSSATPAGVAAEQQLIDLVNQERQRQGLAELTHEPKLTEAAREHAQRMADRGSLSHQFPGEPALRDRIARTDLRFKAVAENVGYANSVERVHSTFMRSPGHRANILDPDYNAVGIGVVRRGDYLYVAQNFAYRLPVYTEVEAEHLLLEQVNQIRSAAGLQPLEVEDSSEVFERACTMAAEQSLRTRDVLRDLRTASHVVTFIASDLTKPPSTLRELSRSRVYRRIAVGPCFAKSEKYPAGAWWVIVALYR
jgi:uncharacterized protein YkwD